MRFLKNKILKAREIAVQNKGQQQCLLSINENQLSPALSTSALKFEDSGEVSLVSMPSQPSTKVEFCEEHYSQSPASQYQLKIEGEIYNEISLQSTVNQSLVKMEEKEGLLWQYPLEQYSFKIENDDFLNSLYESHIISALESETKGKKNSKNNKSANEGKSYAKNVDLNYIKAIISFANSHVAIPYIKVFVQQEGIKFTDFTMFIAKSKECIINGVQVFRSLLIANEKNDPKTEACIRIFKAMSEIFIKCFSVNWITQSRLTHKAAYLKYRFKMLKRIQNPEQFVYVQRNKPKAK